MTWVIRGAFPAFWVVFNADGDAVATGVALTPRGARRAIGEYLDLVQRT